MRGIKASCVFVLLVLMNLCAKADVEDRAATRGILVNWRDIRVREIRVSVSNPIAGLGEISNRTGVGISIIGPRFADRLGADERLIEFGAEAKLGEVMDGLRDAIPGTRISMTRVGLLVEFQGSQDQRDLLSREVSLAKRASVAEVLEEYLMGPGLLYVPPPAWVEKRNAVVDIDKGKVRDLVVQVFDSAGLQFVLLVDTERTVVSIGGKETEPGTAMCVVSLTAREVKHVRPDTQ